MRRTSVRRLLVVGCGALLTSGCAFQGLNSLPLPGAVGRGPGANIYHVELDNVGTLESNSPVLMNDVVIGSVGAMKLKGWHADVEISVKPDVGIPANAVATVGQTSLLGSMHVALRTPLGQTPSGRLVPGATIPLSQSSKYPSTEQTLSAVAAVVNGGGLGQIGGRGQAGGQRGAGQAGRVLALASHRLGLGGIARPQGHALSGLRQGNCQRRAKGARANHADVGPRHADPFRPFGLCSLASQPL